jgi:hypothetical protein
MRYYFAGAYVRRAELKACAKFLTEAGIGASVVSRWLMQDQTGEDVGFSAGNLGSPAAVARAWAYGERDLEDLDMCQVIVSFTGQGERGGRHVEHGYALALRGLIDEMRMVIVGPREHVFHCHPDTEVYADFEEFLNHEINRSGAR